MRRVTGGKTGLNFGATGCGSVSADRQAAADQSQSNLRYRRVQRSRHAL